MKPAILAIALLSFVVYGLAIARFFARPGGMPRRMQWVGVLGAVFAATHLFVLATAPSLPQVASACALALYGGGLFLFGWAAWTTRRQPPVIAFSPDLPGRLVRHGPYGLVRHPFYLAYSLTWTAGAVASLEPLLAATAATMAILYVAVARAEEARFRESGIAADFAAYKDRVGMFRPRWPTPEADARLGARHGGEE